MIQMRQWVHWVLFNLPASINELPESVPTDEELENGAKQGRNDFRRMVMVDHVLWVEHIDTISNFML